MSLLPPSVLPVVPVAFAAGDRITVNGSTHVRSEEGRWTCGRPECPAAFNDESARELFTDPSLLARLGVPLLAPVSVGADSPLPGRPVREGEMPFERDRVYLVAGTEGRSSNPVVPIPETQAAPGPWGPEQRTLTNPALDGIPPNWEMSQTQTGVIWVRFPQGTGTYAYIPAEAPDCGEIEVLLSLVVLALAFPGAIPV
ncbi:hypothetical protein ABZ352_18775 [Streptomyces griseofuscus]|uniref:hypothetical protein n=1 Tax=Streptomyces griseofuscus TaxID=146922 RepID=UPI003403DAF3